MEAIRIGFSHPATRSLEWSIPSQMRVFRFWLTVAFQKGRAVFLLVATYLTIVSSVAIYDIYLTAHYWRSLKEMEENPVGRWLMSLDKLPEGTMPNLTLFIAIKSIGTLIVLAVIATLVLRHSRIGHPVAIGVSGFQMGLAAYLTFGTN